MPHYDVIVVGAGSMGMAAGYYLAKAGVKVLLIDAFNPPHTQGSHNGDTRLIRHAVGEGKEYVPFVLRAQELWDELQAKTNNYIFMKTGVVSVGRSDSDFIEKGLESQETYNLDARYIENGSQLNDIFPDFHVPEEYHGFLEPNAGVLFPENIINTYRRLALEKGAELIVNSSVYDMDVSEEKVSVTNKQGTFTADKMIISAGAYNNKLLPMTGLNLDLSPGRRVIGWFNADEQFYASDVFPGFVLDSPIGNFYGFPSINGTGVKIGKHFDEEQTEPEYINRQFGAYDRDEGLLRGFLDKYMPKAAGNLIRGGVCLYTLTRDAHFVIDKHPNYDNIAIAAGFSGHGFKYASAVGEILSQLMIDGKSELDISVFSATREAVQPKTD